MRPIVAVCTVPRTGSMWLFNVARALAREAGFTVEPDPVPQSNEEMIAAGDAARRSMDARRFWVIKLHHFVKPGARGIKVLSAHRDPRDLMVSWMDFMKGDFERALKVAEAMDVVHRVYGGADPRHAMVVPYAEIERNPVGLIRRIADFTQLKVPFAAVSSIAAAHSREAVRARIAAMEATHAARAAAGQAPEPGEVVDLPGARRAFDPATGFQSGHVSGRASGDWRRRLSPEQQARANEVLREVIARFGYPPE